MAAGVENRRLRWRGWSKVDWCCRGGPVRIAGVPVPHAFRVHGRTVFGAVHTVAIPVTGE